MSMYTIRIARIDDNPDYKESRSSYDHCGRVVEPRTIETEVTTATMTEDQRKRVQKAIIEAFGT